MKVTSFGEVLWDDFPDGKVLGGAPLNVMVRLSSLGADTSIISRRGDDEDGTELVRQIQEKNVATDLIQVDTEHATGLVKVQLDDKGCASYDIVYPCAWDKISVEEMAIVRVAESNAFVFGSLSTRDAASRISLQTLLQVARLKIFDVNLRKPHYDPKRILSLMKQSDVIKLNDDELYELTEVYGEKSNDLEHNIQFLAQLTKVKHICVTLGSHGAVYYRDGEFFANHGYRIDVVDTVGAGDSFLAGFIFKFLSGAEPAEMLSFACALGAMVASRAGATSPIALEEIEQFMNPA